MNARACVRVVPSNDAVRFTFETLKRLRNMLMRWKSKDKSSSKSSSAGPSLGKKKRKFGREGKNVLHQFLRFLLSSLFLFLSHVVLFLFLPFISPNDFPCDFIIC